MKYKEFWNAVKPDGSDIDMKQICGCPDAVTLSQCEKDCPRYHSCHNIALANDILVDYEDHHTPQKGNLP